MARIDLGLTKPKFYRMTPREYGALVKRREEFDLQRGFRAELMAAQIAAMIFNTRMNYAKDAAPARDFMIQNWKKVNAKGEKRMERKQNRLNLALQQEQFKVLLASHLIKTSAPPG